MLENWPIYFKDKLIIGNLDSSVGVATLWMPKESVAAALDSSKFAVCGQLYTKRGINPLLRNLLANPNIRYLVLCGVDRQGSGEALVKLFTLGLAATTNESGNLRGHRIKDDDEALIDIEIPIEAIELIRKNVQLFDLRMKTLDVVSEKVSSLDSPGAYSDPQLYPEAEKSAVERYPSDMSVFKIRRDFIGDAWIDALKTINRFGFVIPGMYGSVREVHNLSIVIEKEDPKSPHLEDYLKFSEEGLERYIKGFFDTDPGSEAYTYGERIFTWDGINQGDIMIEKLKRFPYDRGAMAVLWKPHVDNFPPKDTKTLVNGQTKGWRVPCLVMILGQCIDDNFNMTAVFRNNDIYGAWPLNAFALRQFQSEIAKEIGKDLGSLTTISHVAEIYEIDWDDSLRVVTDNDGLGRTCMYDPRSYYTVNVEGNEILLTFLSPDGSTELAAFREDGKRPKVARDMCAMAMRDLLISELGAACDLGRQLAKAESAIKLGLKFEQDKPLESQT